MIGRIGRGSVLAMVVAADPGDEEDGEQDRGDDGTERRSSGAGAGCGFRRGGFLLRDPRRN
jgi:hypothetical protein